MPSVEELFNPELSRIRTPHLKEFAQQLLGMAPESFLTASAAARERTHSPVVHGEGGLVRHSIDVMERFERLAKKEGLSAYEADVGRVGALLHDMMKYAGEHQYHLGHLELLYEKSHGALLSKTAKGLIDVGALKDVPELPRLLDIWESHMALLPDVEVPAGEHRPTAQLSQLVARADVEAERATVGSFSERVMKMMPERVRNYVSHATPRPARPMPQIGVETPPLMESLGRLPWKKIGIASVAGLAALGAARWFLNRGEDGPVPEEVSLSEYGRRLRYAQRPDQYGLPNSVSRRLQSAPTMGLTNMALGGSADGMHARAAQGHITYG